jgi:ADP-heptose:LPS heptosyltransferase
MGFRVRAISVFMRKRYSAKDGRNMLRSFEAGRQWQGQLPAARPSPRAVLLIRLDDIGDYLLFRNQLTAYKSSPRWRECRLTLLANESWKALFTAWDAPAVDDVIWVHKNRYLESDSYRRDIWRELRARGFETVIAPSCTRPLLLDDLCMLAAAPLRAIGSVNTLVHARLNRLSDDLYQELYQPSRPVMHEFLFNAEFTRWVCGACWPGTRPQLDGPFQPRTPGPYILCFVGASVKSRRWPVRRWIEFIAAWRAAQPAEVCLAGHGPVELAMIAEIRARTAVSHVLTGQSLAQFVDWVAGAQAVVTNDTMAAHLAVSLSRPTVIIANGVNFGRFTEYAGAGIEGVAVVYPEVFVCRRQRSRRSTYDYTEAVTADIVSIRAAAVLQRLEELLRAADCRSAPVADAARAERLPAPSAAAGGRDASTVGAPSRGAHPRHEVSPPPRIGLT